MKNTVLVILSLALFHSSFAQLNPVNNLEWEHWYVCPNNYFVLSWESPDSTLDTLIGYNIYRESELYRFQTETSLYHTDAASNCSEDFVLYNGGQDFWMHVTAVYNSSPQESIYNDSAYCFGYAIGIVENEFQELKIFPNPLTTSTTFEYTLERPENVQITFYNLQGQIVDGMQEKQDKGMQRVEWNAEGLPSGVYLIRLQAGDDIYLRKIVKL